jgi:hypothetical protein
MTYKKIIKIEVPVYLSDTERLYNTASIKHNGKLYCPYCGKELSHFEDWDHYERTDYYNCDCEDATREFEYTRVINHLKNNMPKPQFELKTTVELSKI